MAIQFARVEVIGRSLGRNAAQKSAYNARTQIKLEERTALLKGAYNSRGKSSGLGKVYNFSKRDDREHHEIILPYYADKKFKDVSILMNAVERAEKRRDAQLLKEIVIALPKEEEIGVAGRIDISRRFISKMGWVQEGLGVQLDLHRPHDQKDINYHAHILVTTRRFRKDGNGFDSKKATDLNPEFKSSKKSGVSFIVPEEVMISSKYKEVQEEYFRAQGLDIKVDLLSPTPQKHLGPKRFRTREASKEIAINRKQSIEGSLHHKSSAMEIVKAFTTRNLVFSKGEMRYFMEREGIHNEELLNQIFRLKEVGELRYYYDNADRCRRYRMSGRYVLKEQWEQVERGMRHAEKIYSFRIRFRKKKVERLKESIESLSKSYQLSFMQKIAYKNLALDGAGFKVLRGVAGSGKSRVLGALHDLYSPHMRVIGIAPTHKAVNVLREQCFKEAETVTSFLWKMEKGMMSLKSRSLVILDEGSMVSNNSYDRLLKICKDKGLRLIISGDERQLSSIERGGIFDRIIGEFDDVRLGHVLRQLSHEDVRVAELLADGRIDLAVRKLGDLQRTSFEYSEQESIHRLIKDWAYDKSLVKDRLIIASKNKDVDMFNLSIHEVMLSSWKGGVMGVYKKEYLDSDGKRVIRSEDYIVGERIVFSGTCRDLEIYNGDFGEIVKIDKDLLAVRIDREDRIVQFNPKNFGEFKYGYASTVYKSQGASVKSVFIYHEGYGNKKNSYVALTRHKERVMIYCNSQKTRNYSELARQLGSDREFCMDRKYRLPYLYEDRIEKLRHESGRLARYKTVALRGIVAIRNWYRDFDVERAPVIRRNEMRVVDSKINLEDRSSSFVKSIVQEKSEIKQQVSKIKQQVSKIKREVKKQAKQNVNRIDLREIRALARDNIRSISREIFGAENGQLSNAEVLKFGSKGKVAVHLAGERRGLWYDFSQGEGGDAIKLLQKQFGLSFRESVKYLQEKYGRGLIEINKGKTLRKDKQPEESKRIRIDKEEKDKLCLENSYQKSKELDRIGSSYFMHRGISQVASLDIRSGRNYDRESKKYYKSVVVFARDKEGEIKASQSIYLKEMEGIVRKADISVPKRSFGKVKGSYVLLGDNRVDKKGGITYISEGVENGLSVKESGVRGRFVASLGISNMKNYEPYKGEKIILLCDNDGKNNRTEKVIEDSKNILERRGALVEITRPKEQGYDYNDLLLKSGKNVVKHSLGSSIRGVEEQERAQNKINQGLSEDILSSINELKRLNPEYNLLHLRKEIMRGGKYFGAEISDVVQRDVRREFAKCSRELLSQNRNLGRGNSVLPLGKIVLEELRIVKEIKWYSPRIMRNVSSFRSKNSEVTDERVENLVKSLEKYVEHIPEQKKIALDIMDQRGIVGLSLACDELCRRSLEHKIERDLLTLRKRNGEVLDLNGEPQRNRGEYVRSLLRDDEVKSMIENQKIIDQMERIEQQQRQHQLSIRR